MARVQGGLFRIKPYQKLEPYSTVGSTLGTNAWYVGALGSKRTAEKRLNRLRQLNVPEQQIVRLHAPVGLDIGSKTPIEIAVSIVAELTQLRRRSTVP